MREVQLTQGYVAKVDDEDFEEVNKYSWHVLKTPRHLYAMRHGWKGEEGTIYLHRFITKAEKGMEVDHLDGDSLNNCRSNLRVCTRSDNQRNQYRHRSGKAGVHRNKQGYYVAQSCRKGKYSYLGMSKTEEGARRIYKKFMQGQSNINQ